MRRDDIGLVTPPGSTEHLRLIALAYDLRGVDRNVLADYARDVFYAGRQAGERTRAEQRAPHDAVVDSRRTRWFWLVIELLASATTLFGMALGSTTATGAAWYLASAFVWIWLSIGRRLWGLMPLNLIALLIEVVNFIRASG